MGASLRPATTAAGIPPRRFHPFRVADASPTTCRRSAHLRPIADALQLLQRLHRRRNYVPVAETLQELLDATRAHVGFALRTGGEQALANVLHVAELARQYEIGRRHLVPRLRRRAARRGRERRRRRRRRFSKRTATACA